MSGYLRRRLTGFSRKEQPRIYLGTLSVAPRAGIKKFLDDLAWPGLEEVPHELRGVLIDLFAFPLISSRDIPGESDLVLDIFVPDYQLGGDLLVASDWGVLSFLWRPKVTVAARLVQIENHKTLLIFKATQALSWKGYAVRLFLAPFQSRPLKSDLKILLYRACTKVLMKIKHHLD